MPATPPNSRTNLDKAIQRLAGNPVRSLELRSLLAAAIVGQFMPKGVAKGGGALQLRFGSAGMRVTHDPDAARRGRLDEFVDALGQGLQAGWNGFTGVVVPGRPARPRGVPGEYVMHPFAVKLAYRGQPWCTVTLEVGHNEIGDADTPDLVLSPEVSAWFASLGFPPPAPVPLMPLEYQMARKLHAATAPGSSRAHDLVDLQLIAARAGFDMPRLRAICVRLFKYRRMQPWPPRVDPPPGWTDLYAARAAGLDVLQDVTAAAAWTNALIARIDAAH